MSCKSVLTGHAEAPLVADAIKSGAHGYILKDMRLDDRAHALRSGAHEVFALTDASAESFRLVAECAIARATTSQLDADSPTSSWLDYQPMSRQGPAPNRSERLEQGPPRW